MEVADRAVGLNEEAWAGERLLGPETNTDESQNHL